MKKVILTLGSFLCIGALWSQKTPDKTLAFENKVDDLIVVPFNGMAVVSEGDKIHGYNPQDEGILWTIDAPKRDKADVAAQVLSTGSITGVPLDFTVIEDTPFLLKFFDDKLYVYNSNNGDLLFSAVDKERYFQAEYLFDENAFLLRGIDNKDLIIAKYSLNRKSFDWKTTVSKTFGVFLQSLAKLSADSDMVYRDLMEHSEDKIFALIKSKFYVLDKQSGNLLWSKEDDDITDFKTSLDGNKLITIKTKGLFANKSEIDLYDSATGTTVWDESLKTKYLVRFEDWQDKMLLAHYKGFNFYDYNTGKKLWKKDPKGKGIKSVIPIDSNFLYVYDDEMMLIDKKGEKLWKSDVKICDDEEDPVHFLEKTKNGRILYITATYANLVDYKTGKKIWNGNLKLNEKRPTFSEYNEATGEFIVFNDEELYKFNETTEDRPKPYAKLKLKNEKLITGLELFENNVSISGQSEVIGVSHNGEVVFHNTYVQPGELGRRLLKTAFITGQVVGSIATAEVTIKGTYKDSEGNEVNSSSSHPLFGQKAKALGEAGYLIGSVGQTFVQSRYDAMQETDNYALIFAKGDNGEKLLIKVNKESGEEMTKIVLENNKPIYDVDYVSDDIYYSKDKEVKIFRGL